MSFTLSMSGVIVGRTELENRDARRRVASGVFRPGLGYDLAEPVFGLYAAANGEPNAVGRYRKAMEALNLQLTDSSGRMVPIRALNVRRETTSVPRDAGLVIEIETDDPAIWTASDAAS